MKGLAKDNEVRSRICSKSGEEKDSKAHCFFWTSNLQAGTSANPHYSTQVCFAASLEICDLALWWLCSLSWYEYTRSLFGILTEACPNFALASHPIFNLIFCDVSQARKMWGVRLEQCGYCRCCRKEQMQAASNGSHMNDTFLVIKKTIPQTCTVKNVWIFLCRDRHICNPDLQTPQKAKRCVFLF